MKERITYIDCMKGFATISVVIVHVFDGYMKAGLYSSFLDFMHTISSFISMYHMSLFFIISGLLFKMAYFRADGSIKPSIKPQILNIAVIYVIYSILFGLFKIICGSYTNNSPSITDILMIWIKPIYPYWYLYLLLFYYIIFSRNRIANLKTVGISAVLLVAIISSVLIPNDIGLFFDIKHFLFYIPFFFIGTFICKDKKNILYKKPLVIILFILAVAVIVLAKYKIINYEKFFFVVSLGITIALFNFLKWVFSNEKYVYVRFFKFIGSYALEIYVMHCVFTAGNRVVLQKLHINNFWMNITCNTIISVALPIIIALVCKKLNLHKIIFRPVYFVNDIKKNKLKNAK